MTTADTKAAMKAAGISDRFSGTVTDIKTGEVLSAPVLSDSPIMDLKRANEITAQLLTACETVTALAIEAYQGRVWISKGYDSWAQYCEGESIHIPRQYIPELLVEGMPTRAIGAATGVSHTTVRREAGGTNVPPVRTTGLDGKSYPASQPRKPWAEPDCGYDRDRIRTDFPTLADVEIDYVVTRQPKGDENHPTWCSLVNPLVAVGLLKSIDNDTVDDTPKLAKYASAEWKAWSKATKQARLDFKAEWAKIDTEGKRLDAEVTAHNADIKYLVQIERDRVAELLAASIEKGKK